MFERYTEKARRVIFFARKEASDFGTEAIESEHLLLALLREGKSLLNTYRLNEAEIRAAIEKVTVTGNSIPTVIDLPLSNECKYILGFSAEEADRLRHTHIGTEHLLVGILREENCLAARLLRERGLQLETARAALTPNNEPSGIGSGSGRGIGSGAGSPRNIATIDVVDADSSELLVSYQHSALIPRVGETLLIYEGSSPDSSYRVRDVIWEFSRTAGGSSLKDVIISVQKSQPAKTESEAVTQSRPVISVNIRSKHEQDIDKLPIVLADLMREDPTMSVSTDATRAQIVLSGMHEQHLEQICERITREFSIELDADEPRVIYLETITKPAEAEGKYIRQTGGVGHYGHVKIRLEPAEAEFEFVTEIKGRVVPQEYFKPIERGIREALRGGVLAGHELVKVKATLFDGSFHEFDSNEMAFAIAASMALKEAARKAHPVVLEPMMTVEIVVPQDQVRSAFVDVNDRRGRILGIKERATSQIIRAIVPLSELLRFSKQGRPPWSMQFNRYEQAPRRGPNGGNEASAPALKQ